jgi:hypothetical protein
VSAQSIGVAPTRTLMSFTAVTLGLFGLVATFTPDGLLARLGEPITPLLVLIVQVLGAMYVGFAMLDWMARANLIGGIYSRPVAIGNLVHFVVAGLAIIKAMADTPALRFLWPIAVVYSALAICFALVLFRHPVPTAS